MNENSRFRRVTNEPPRDELITGEISSLSAEAAGRALRGDEMSSSAAGQEVETSSEENSRIANACIAEELADAAEQDLARFAKKLPRLELDAQLGEVQAIPVREGSRHGRFKILAERPIAKGNWRGKIGVVLVSLAVCVLLLPAIVVRVKQIVISEQPFWGKNNIPRANDRTLFHTIRAIAQAPGIFASGGVASVVGGDYEQGALAAEEVLLERLFMAATDPEVRLALLSVQAERAIKDGDLRSIVLLIRRSEWIPNHDRDSRAAQIRESLYRKLAQISPPTQRANWEQRADSEAERAKSLRIRIRGNGWTERTIKELRLGILDAEADPWALDGRSARYEEGYRAAIAEAVKYYNLWINAIPGDAADRLRIAYP